MEELIAKRYVKALLEVIPENQREDYSYILNSLSALFDNRTFKDIIESPIVSSKQKADLLLEPLKSRNIPLINLIKVLAENGRLSLIPYIAKSLNQEVQKERNEYEGIVSSGDELSLDDIAKLEKSLATYTGSTIKLTQQKSNLDGIKVTVDDLGIEVNFSKERVKEQLIDFITKSL
jgi:F-type H+-transporting ATPase subunit delta